MIHHAVQEEIVENRRKERRRDHIGVGHLQEFRDHERGGPHDRRRNLAAIRRDSLDGSGIACRKAGFANRMRRVKNAGIFIIKDLQSEINWM